MSEPRAKVFGGGGSRPSNTLWTTQPKFLVGHPAYPAAPLWGLGSAGCKLAPGGVRGGAPPQSHFAVSYARKTHLIAAFWLVSIAMSGKMETTPSRLRSNLVSAGNLSHINIIVFQTGKLIFV